MEEKQKKKMEEMINKGKNILEEFDTFKGFLK